MSHVLSHGFLDFYNILVNELVGDALLFILLIFAGITILLVRARATSEIYMMTMFTVATMLSVPFPFLRWLVLVFGLGFAGWIINGRLRRE